MSMDNYKKRNQFWKQISTGLRTPLNVIKGTADIAVDEIYDIETVRNGFEKIEQSSDYLLNVVNDIVDFISIENGEIVIQQTPFSMRTLICNLTEEYYKKFKWEEKKLNVQVHNVRHENLIGDAHRSEQILNSMFTNSLKNTAAGDELKLEVTEGRAGEEKTEYRFVLHITNPSLYERLSGTVNEKVVTDATDISLYNCHYLLEEMGGTIEVFRDDEGSSRIEICMEFEIDDRPELKPESDCEDEKILVVGESVEDAAARETFLKGMNLKCGAATQFDEALERLGEADAEGDAYSLCIVDWDIENFALQEFINEVRSIFGREMPIVAMAYDTEKVAVKAKKTGFSYLMDKTWFPSTVQELLNKKKQGKFSDYEDDFNMYKSYDFHGRHVLVVEDAPLNLDTIVKILTKVNLDVTCAVNGAEALTLYNSKPEGYFECILMDITMPLMDGFEATRRIRRSGRADAESVPVFALTANAFTEDIEEAQASGMDGHFSKPVDINVLYRTLRQVLSDCDDETYAFREKSKSEGNKEINDDEPFAGPATDDVTGLMNRRGFETRIDMISYRNQLVGCILMELNCTRAIDLDTEKEIRIYISGVLKDVFCDDALLVTLSESLFMAVLQDNHQSPEDVRKKVYRINESLTQKYEGVKLDTGCSFSENGFSRRLLRTAEYALYHAQNSAEDGFYIINDKADLTKELITDSYFRHNMMGTNVYYAENEKAFQLPEVETVFTELMCSNNAIGILCGSYEDKLPICFFSGFTLSNLGYDLNSFSRSTGNYFSNLVYYEDLPLLSEFENNQDDGNMTLRMKSASGDILWFYMIYKTVKASDGRRMWVASLRPIDDDVAGRMCDMDYLGVALVFPEEKTLLIEKGMEHVHNANLKRRKKYNYDSLLSDVVIDLYKEEERDKLIQKTRLEKIVEEIDKKGLYEFTIYQKMENGEYSPLRYKYRRLEHQRSCILWTLENVEAFAEYDDVTSLLNESGFCREVEKILHSRENSDKEYALLYFNIKNFKSWNDVLGYENSDMLLHKFGELLKNSEMRPVCSGRIRSDHFCVLVEMSTLDFDEITALCHRKFNIEGNDIFVHSNCGIYQIRDINQKISIMCDKAVLAEKNISNEYAVPYYIYDKKIKESYENHIFVLNNLERAFARDEFQIYYQPVCDTVTGKICSAESLVRWVLPGGKFVSPGAFVPVLEEKGYITKLDLMVHDKVQAFLKDRITRNKKTVPLSINLSRMDFLNESFIEELSRTVAAANGIEQQMLRYEVTESAYSDINEYGQNLITDLRNSGAKIYIDDFGTGYSSLQGIMETQFDTVKLDMSFVSKIGQNPLAEGIIESAIILSHRLGRQTIAEGVETDEQRQFLADKGCDYIQGYYFYKPMPESEFVQLLEKEELGV